MAKTAAESRYCKKCRKELEEDKFFKHRDKYTSFCKQCILNELEQNPSEPLLYIPYMKELDIPFVYDEWSKFYRKEKLKTEEDQNMRRILPKYISMMKLKGWLRYHFSDSIRLEEWSIAQKYYEIEYRKNLVKDIFLRARIINK